MAYDPTICATATMTLALPKQGLLNPEVKAHIGELYLADIGVPPEIYLAMGIKVASLFNQEEIIHIA